MTLFFRTLTCIFVAVIINLLIDLSFKLLKKITDAERPVILIIGILSARENLEQRSIARLTWLKNYLSNNSSYVKTFFILGNSSCTIPPEYRLNPYSCEKWNINVSNTEGNIYTSLEIENRNSSSQKKTLLYQGFTFKVNSPIIVTKLGVLHSAFFPSTAAKVTIMDIQTKDIIVQATVVNNSSISTNGYIFSSIENILFPKGYEGLILFEGYMQHSTYSTLIWNDGGGVITFQRMYFSPHHLDSVAYSPNVSSIVSMEFYINDSENLKSFTERETEATKQWQMELREIQRKIDAEQEQYDDLLVLDLIDTYRNLPNKMLHFYKWLQMSEKFSYVMKVDDDSIINVDLILKKLQENPKFNSNLLWIWSSFRKDWAVNYVGKWSDHEYKSTIYPLFPCGAAYVLSRATISWLSVNYEFLFPYQGEDVSLGIWLSAINPNFIEDEYFECNSKCSINSYNRAQLNQDQIQHAWSSFTKCHNLCTCDNIMYEQMVF